MKKRFTLMMMVLCFLMSIPLKMMAEIVTIHFVDEDGWGDYAAYVYDKTKPNDGSNLVTDAWPGQVATATDIKVVDGNKKEVTWKIDLKSCELSNALVIFNNNNGGKQYPTSSGWDVIDGASYNKDGKITSSSEGGSGGSTGGSTGGNTPVDWNTVTTNRLTGKKYTQGFYLAGNFFTFDKVDGEYKINYNDAVFKFQQQKSINEIAETAYDVYMVEIPASLDAHAQVMYVDETGTAKKLFCPISAYGISETCPTTEAKSTNWETLKGTEEFSENNNYWDFSTRNKPNKGYSDGLYEVYIAVDKNTHEPAKWMITHQAKKRVAYFISDAPDATAMPLYDTYKKDDPQFSNKFFATVNLAANRSYYVISNYIYNNTKVNDAKDYGAFDPGLHAIPSQTTNKLFLQGNGDLDFTGARPNNLIFPNGAPLKVDKKYWGTRIVEYNPSKGNRDKTVYGFNGELLLRGDRAVLTSVSLVGNAIPGTLNADGTWNYKSNAADMVYDETEQCYKARVVTTAEAYGKPFRFVGNRDQKITWYENTNTDQNEKAKCPYDLESAPGHTADANDPNKVNYTQDGDPTKEDYDSWNIIWNRPAGCWTVRLYFYTYSDGNDPKTDYYYTITANRDMELHDLVDVVYGSEANKQNITNLGGYRYMRTWSAQKSWKISDKVDIFVVSSITDDKSGVVKMTLKNINGYVSGGDDHVIPANTGVILATTSDAASKIPGAKFKSREDFTSYNNLVIPMEQYDTDVTYDGSNFLKPILLSRVIPSSDKDNYNYLFGYYNAQIATGDKINYGADKYLLGFWISKGSKSYLSSSSYLPIDKETAAKMNRLGTSYDDFGPAVGSAKKVPGVIFDFDNVGGTTGINEVVNQSTQLNDGKYYTLSGQQVEKPTAGGIYIHNGRKFVVK
ncbi:MAG: starch-binding protein [Prevotella sp.]|nr:starch-binding protein [Prevotella sp.]